MEHLLFAERETEAALSAQVDDMRPAFVPVVVWLGQKPVEVPLPARSLQTLNLVVAWQFAVVECCVGERLVPWQFRPLDVMGRPLMLLRPVWTALPADSSWPEEIADT